MRHDFTYSDKLFHVDIGTEVFFRTIEKELPPLVSRAEASRITGGLISAKTLCNEDSLNKGPREPVRIGSKIGYTREAFMAYLRRKTKSW